MLTPVLGHAGQPPAPHDVWSAWNLDPILLLGIIVSVGLYARGRRTGPRRPVDTWRARAFSGALLALAVALISPLEALSTALASAHMVQHVVLILVAAPLLALSAPGSALLRGAPVSVRRQTGRWRRGLRLTYGGLRALRHPVVVWLLHVVTLWFWHAAVPYDAALDNEAIHILEHVTFIVTAVLFWRVVIGGRSGSRVPPGLGVLLVFAMAVQSVLLSVLLTFATTPWYSSYAETTARWGLEPLADQQLAGVIMWVPAGFVYLAAGLGLLVSLLRLTERESVPV